MNQEKVQAEISIELDRLAKAQEPWRADWVTQQVCVAHHGGLAQNDEAEFWRWAGYRTIREMVRKAINKRAGPTASEASHQLVIEGFERKRLQDYYVVERGGHETGVPVIYCTDDELRQRAAEYRAMGQGLIEHAREIEDYMEWRKTSQVSYGQ